MGSKRSILCLVGLLLLLNAIVLTVLLVRSSQRSDGLSVDEYFGSHWRSFDGLSVNGLRPGMKISEVINVIGRPSRVEMWGFGREAWTFKGKTGDVQVCFWNGRSSAIYGTMLELKGKAIASAGTGLDDLRQKLRGAGIFPEEYYPGPGDKALSYWPRALLAVISKSGVITEIRMGNVVHSN